MVLITKEVSEQYDKTTNFRFLGELSGMVYRMSFEMDIDGKTKEYMVIVNNLD
jgi:hypothetical protein